MDVQKLRAVHRVHGQYIISAVLAPRSAKACFSSPHVSLSSGQQEKKQKPTSLLSNCITLAPVVASLSNPIHSFHSLTHSLTHALNSIHLTKRGAGQKTPSEASIRPFAPRPRKTPLIRASSSDDKYQKERGIAGGTTTLMSECMRALRDGYVHVCLCDVLCCVVYVPGQMGCVFTTCLEYQE